MTPFNYNANTYCIVFHVWRLADPRDRGKLHVAKTLGVHRSCRPLTRQHVGIGSRAGDVMTRSGAFGLVQDGKFDLSRKWPFKVIIIRALH